MLSSSPHPFVISTFVRFRFALQRARWRASRAAQVIIVLKYVAFARTLGWALSILATHAAAPWQSVADMSIVRGVGLGLIAGMLAAHLGIPMITVLPEAPFRRVMTDAAWIARSYAFPVLSEGFLVFTIAAVAALGAVGGATATTFYIAFVVSARQPSLRAAVLGLGLGVEPLTRVVSTPAALITTSLLLATLIALDATRVARSGQTFAEARLDIVRDRTVRKELACLRYFASDRWYLAVSVLVAALVITSQLAHFDNGGRSLGALWFFPALVVQPFARIIFNLFGSEGRAIRWMGAVPERAMLALSRRVSLYRGAIYAGHCVVLAAVWATTHDLGRWITLVAASLVVTEWVILFAIPYSILLRRAKQPQYSYASDLTSANLRLSPLVALAATSAAYALDRVAGVAGIVALLAAALATNPSATRWSVARLAAAGMERAHG